MIDWPDSKGKLGAGLFVVSPLILIAGYIFPEYKTVSRLAWYTAVAGLLLVIWWYKEYRRLNRISMELNKFAATLKARNPRP